MNQEKRKSNRRNYVSRKNSTKASSSVADTNVVINVDTASQKLQKLESVYQHKNDFSDTRGFLTYLRVALGIPNERGASKYGVIKNKDFVSSISLTNHNPNAQTYIDNNANYPYNLRLMIRRRFRKNSFKAHPSVILNEYVYFGQEMDKCTQGNPYLLIIDSLIDFLGKGIYEDKTGIAHKNVSPQITECELKSIISNSVKEILQESKKVNNKPHFLMVTPDFDEYDNLDYVESYALPGEYADYAVGEDDCPAMAFRVIAKALRSKGTLVYFEPEGMADKSVLDSIKVSDIVKFSGEKISDVSFMDSFNDKLIIQTAGNDGLRFRLRGGEWITTPAVPVDNVVDWEGAGDWTTSVFIDSLCRKDALYLSSLSEVDIRASLMEAQSVASRSLAYLSSKGMIHAGAI